MNTMRMETPDLTARNVEKIATLFPNCVTEMRDEKGKVTRGIDFAMLKQMLSPAVVEGAEHYEFSWVGKKAAIVEANKSIRKTLRPCPEESKDWDTTENLYIEGDNLEVLKLLQESYLGKVKMIYIDPPYNTGNDFIYVDDFHRLQQEENVQAGMFDEDENRLFKNTDTNGRFHSDWCSMMYSRLMLARNLLADDGVIFISIDYNENFNLRSLCDEIFGTDMFVGEIYWESKTKSQNTVTAFDKLQPKMEVVLVYARHKKFHFNLLVKGQKQYPLTDEKGVYREYLLEEMNASGVRGRESMIFPISDGVSTVSPRAGKQWQLGQAQVATYLKEGNLFIREGSVIIKMRPGMERSDQTEPFWGFLDKTIGTAESAKKDLTALLGTHGFETVKPVALIQRLIYHATRKADSLILDFFSGSATTAHAVMALNAEDGGKRKFIMVQLPEPCDKKSSVVGGGYNTICEIGKERIRRAGEKIRQEHPEAKGLDVGFRVLKLADSNMKDVFYAPEDYDQSILAKLESNIKEDRSALDLLFGCLLEWGLPLGLPYTVEQIEGCAVHVYNDGDLIACFEEEIPESVVTAIARRKPLRAVFRDSGFADSPAKINVFEIFKRFMPEDADDISKRVRVL